MNSTPALPQDPPPVKPAGKQILLSVGCSYALQGVFSHFLGRIIGPYLGRMDAGTFALSFITVIGLCALIKPFLIPVIGKIPRYTGFALSLAAFPCLLLGPVNILLALICWSIGYLGMILLDVTADSTLLGCAKTSSFPLIQTLASVGGTTLASTVASVFDISFPAYLLTMTLIAGICAFGVVHWLPPRRDLKRIVALSATSISKREPITPGEKELIRVALIFFTVKHNRIHQWSYLHLYSR